MFGLNQSDVGSIPSARSVSKMCIRDRVTIKRKVTEIFRALRLEKNYSKDEILETYLNLVYFGNGCNGIEACLLYTSRCV